MNYNKMELPEIFVDEKKYSGVEKNFLLNPVKVQGLQNVTLENNKSKYFTGQNKLKKRQKFSSNSSCLEPKVNLLIHQKREGNLGRSSEQKNKGTQNVIDNKEETTENTSLAVKKQEIIKPEKEVSLRPYQQECVDTIDHLEKGNYLTVLFTGAGKTVIFSHIKRQGKMLILSHREELVYQPKKYYDCTYGVERAEERSHGEEVISASVLSMVNRLRNFSPDEFDTIIVDEAHHVVAPVYRKILDYFSDARLVLGFTATPNRADETGLGAVFDDVIFERDIQWGIQNKYLVDIRCIRANIGYNLNKIKTQMGDFASGELGGRVDQPGFNKAIAKIYQEKAVGQTVIFAASVEHCFHLQEVIPGSEVIVATTENRADILDRFQKGEVKCLINNLILTEGTDLPMIETIIMCRPTKNLLLYTQCVGRGLRLYKDKKELRLIDCVGVTDQKICTATDLIGLDLDERSLRNASGKSLMEIQSEIEEEKRRKEEEKKRKKEEKKRRKALRKEKERLYKESFKTSETYKIRYKDIDMFARDRGIKTHGVDYQISLDGNFVVYAGNTDANTSVQFVITPENLLGKTKVYKVSETDNGKRQVKETLMYDNVKLQTAFNLIHDRLLMQYHHNRILWDTTVGKWRGEPATQKQINYIKFLYQGEKMDFTNMTKQEASRLISAKK